MRMIRLTRRSRWSPGHAGSDNIKSQRTGAGRSGQCEGPEKNPGREEPHNGPRRDGRSKRGRRDTPTDVTLERDVPAEMRDGTVLRADVYRPPTSEPSPVLLARSPYGKTVNVSTFGSAHPMWLSEHGYVVVVQDTRGRCSSSMFGFSYVGATQLLAAVTRPPSLVSIAPAFTSSQYYDGWTYNSGALATAFVCYWANLLALDAAMHDHDGSAVDGLLTSLGQAPEGIGHCLSPSTSPSREATLLTSSTGSSTTPMTTTGGAGASTRTTAASKFPHYRSAVGTTSS